MATINHRHIYIYIYICSITHCGNINKDTTTYQYTYVSVTTYYPTVIAPSYQLCHQGTICEWLLTNLTPAVSGHYYRQTRLDGRIYIYIYVCVCASAFGWCSLPWTNLTLD